MSAAAMRPTEKPLAREGDVRIVAHDCHAAKGTRPEAERFADASISIVRSGVFGFRSEQRTQLLTSGFLLLGNPGQSYAISHEYAGGDRCLAFHFAPTLIADVASAHRGPSARRYFRRSVVTPLPRVDVFRRLAERGIATQLDSLGLEELGVALAAYVLRESGAEARPSDDAGRRTRDRVYTALDTLERHATDDIHLSQLAASVELSPFHFLRVFKRETGITPHRFLVQARIRRAIGLLRDTESPVTQVAYDVGFGDLSNFIHTFSREVGCSPSRFRRAAPRDLVRALTPGAASS